MNRSICLFLLVLFIPSCSSATAREAVFASQAAATIFAEETVAVASVTPAAALRSAQPLASWTPAPPGPAATPSHALTPTPSLEGTPVQPALVAISAASASGMLQLAQLGSGVIYDAVISPDGTWFAHATSLGADVFDASDGLPRYHFPSPAACRSAAACPDGTCLLLACDDRRLHVVAPARGEETATLWTSVGEGMPLALQFTDDSRVLLAWTHGPYYGYSDSSDIQAWSAMDWEKRAGLPLSSSRIYDVATDRTGAVVAVAVDEDQVLVFDLAKGERLGVFSGRAPIDLTPDGEILALNGGSSVELWGVADGMQRRRIKIDDAHVAVARFSPDGLLIALGGTRWTGDSNGFVSLWSLQGELLQELVAHPSPVEDMTFSASGRWLASASEEGVIRVWDVTRRNLGAGLRMGLAGAGRIAFLADERAVAAAAPNGAVSLWALPEADRLWSNTGFVVTGPISDVAVAPDGQSLAAATSEGSVYVWDLASGMRRLTLNQPAQVVQTAGVAFGPDGKVLLSVGDSIRQWELSEGTLMHQVVLTKVERSYNADPEYVRWVLASTQNGPVILVTRDEMLDIRRGRDLQAMISLRCVTESGSSPLALSPDGGLLATWRSGMLEGCDDIQPGLALLDAATGSVVVSAEAGLEGYWPLLAFSPDGNLLALAGNTVDLRRTSDLSRVRSLGPTNREIELTSLAFAPDGETLAVGTRDGGISIWEVRTGDELVWLEGHTLSVTGLAFTPDGRALVSSSEDGTLRLWGVP